MRWYKRLQNESNKDYPMISNLELHDQVENGVFWFDEIRKYRGENYKRLNLALNQLPLPAAFDEAAIAIRAIIKEKKKESKDFSRELLALYKLACVRSFMLDYSETVKIPGCGIMTSIPGGMLFGLPMDYKTMGYKQLKILKVNDIKDLVKAFGEPESHTTMHEVYKEIWIDYEKKELKRWKL